MITFPNAKINLGLHISGRRADGYHNIETVFYPIPFYDALEFVEYPEFHFTTTGLGCGAVEENLCVKAYRLLKKHYTRIPAIQLHLHKAIPSGAGLGGGSADAAFTLAMLNKKFSLNITEPLLSQYALELGSDCPFFLLNTPAHAAGRGEQLSKVSLRLKGYRLLLVLPDLHISTKALFQQIAPAPDVIRISEAVEQPVQTWKELLKNDFEPVAFRLHPTLEEIKNTLYEMGAVYAAMTGTGSCIYGLFTEEKPIPDNTFSTFRWCVL